MPLCAAETGSTSELDKLYVTLDSLLDNRERIYSEKEKRIEVVRAGLDDPRLGDSERYALQDRLYNEYCAFKYDSAYKYVMSNVVTAQKLGDASKEALSKLHLTHILSVSGLFDQAELTLNELNPDQLDDKTKVEYLQPAWRTQPLPVGVCREHKIFQPLPRQGADLQTANNRHCRPHNLRIRILTGGIPL